MKHVQNDVTVFEGVEKKNMFNDSSLLKVCKKTYC